MSRKTVNVDFVKDMVNKILDPKICPELCEENRRTAAAILSAVLHETGNYKGFKFLDVEYVTDDDGMIVESIVPDDSARRYY